MSLAILGAGAFGQALAGTLGTDRPVSIWGRRGVAQAMPAGVTVLGDLAELASDTVLLAVPMQALAGFVGDHAARLDGRRLVACCKGIDLATGLGPAGVLARACPRATVAVLTGPAFAADLAMGLPTAMTLACADEAAAAALQAALSTRSLRLYRTSDVAGAELGGAVKNVIAIAAGVTIGAGLGASARAAVITRGQAEMVRLALALGARAETLAGLSGLGDLVLTCTSPQSRNFRYGEALGAGRDFDTAITVEGVATARALMHLAAARGVEMPISATVAALVDGTVRVDQAVQSLLSRPLKPE